MTNEDPTPPVENVKQETAKPAAKVRRKRKGKKRGRKTASKKSATNHGGAGTQFPRTTVENALALGDAIQQHAAGQKIRRLTLFEKMDKSPESGPSRMMITNSSR